MKFHFLKTFMQWPNLLTTFPVQDHLAVMSQIQFDFNCRHLQLCLMPGKYGSSLWQAQQEMSGWGSGTVAHSLTVDYLGFVLLRFHISSLSLYLFQQHAFRLESWEKQKKKLFRLRLKVCLHQMWSPGPFGVCVSPQSLFIITIM